MWRAQRETARDYLFDRIVFVDTLKDATALWEQQPCAAPDGPIFVTRAGEILDAAGVIIGGQTSATGGLLQRRREVLDLDAQRLSLTGGLRRREAATRTIAGTGTGVARAEPATHGVAA